MVVVRGALGELTGCGDVFSIPYSQFQFAQEPLLETCPRGESARRGGSPGGSVEDIGVVQCAICLCAQRVPLAHWRRAIQTETPLCEAQRQAVGAASGCQ